MRINSIWEGRGLKIRILQVGHSIIWVERLDLSINLPESYRIHPWLIDDMKGMIKLN